MNVACLGVQGSSILQFVWLTSLVDSYEGNEHATALFSQLAINSIAHAPMLLRRGFFITRIGCMWAVEAN